MILRGHQHALVIKAVYHALVVVDLVKHSSHYLLYLNGGKYCFVTVVKVFTLTSLVSESACLLASFLASLCGYCIFHSWGHFGMSWLLLIRFIRLLMVECLLLRAVESQVTCTI